MSRFKKRLLYILSTGSFVIASCKMDYGMPVDIDYFKAVKVQTEDNQPIEGLSVSLLDNNDTLFMNTTNSEGVVEMEYEFNEYDSYYVIIEDTDSEDNLGDFETKTAKLTEPDTTIVTIQKKN